MSMSRAYQLSGLLALYCCIATRGRCRRRLWIMNCRSLPPSAMPGPLC